MPSLGAELFGVALRSFELRRFLRRPEYGDTVCREIVGDAGDERRLRAATTTVEPWSRQKAATAA